MQLNSESVYSYGAAVFEVFNVLITCNSAGWVNFYIQ